MTNDEMIQILRNLGACSESLAWLAAEQHQTVAAAWDACPRGDWLLWIAARVGVDRRILVLAACDCAEPALVHVPAGEDRPRIAIETTRPWARGEATIEEVREARRAAYAAANAASCAADNAYADAAYAAANAANAAFAFAAAAAADAADAANAAADAAAYAAAAAAAAAAAYAAADARRASRARSADLVRARISGSEVERLLVSK
jgi:hypothetical protein